jgi:hypothetical protein
MGLNISELPELTSSYYTSFDNVIPIYDSNDSSITNQNKKLSFLKLYKNLSNNVLNKNDISRLNYFGTGKDGSLTLSSSVQTSSSFSSSYNGDFLIKQFTDFTVQSGVTCSVINPCRGLIIFCTGNCTISGLLTMTAKGGGIATATNPFWSASVATLNASLYVNTGSVTPWNWAKTGSLWLNYYKTEIPLQSLVSGGLQRQYPLTGSAGQAGIGTGGGGGAGGNHNFSTPPTQSGAYGGSGSLFCGGGGGAGAYANTLYSSSAYANFEIGGNSISLAGGGAGNPAGDSITFPSFGFNSKFGVGGLLILVVKGDLTLTGKISSEGSNGGSSSFNFGAGGGGSGGGRIILLYGGTYTNLGTTTAAGGIGGTVSGINATPGGNGGAGAITVLKVIP